MEDLLDEGYVVALDADARVRRMRDRLDALSKRVPRPATAGEAWRLMGEKRQVEQSARRLRMRLGAVRSLVVRCVARRADSG